MKRYILTLLLAACVCTACDKDDEYEIREWTVASQLGIAHGASTLQPVLLVKANDDTSWRAVYQGIEGFDFEAGYEYRLRIKAEQLPDPPQDGSSIRYTLLEQISKTPATSVIPDQFFPVFTMEVAPQPMNYRGQRFLGVRFPESGLNEWQPWPFRIEGFEYEPGYIYRLRIGTSVIPAPDSPEGITPSATRCSTWTGSLQRIKMRRNVLKTKTTLPGRFFMAGKRSLPAEPRLRTLPSRGRGYSPSGSSCTGTPFFRVANERICHVTPMATASRAACAHHQAVSSAKMQ